nr:MAG TPA: hypothetical protein [Caudoviricetes sp.]
MYAWASAGCTAILSFLQLANCQKVWLYFNVLKNKDNLAPIWRIKHI